MVERYQRGGAKQKLLGNHQKCWIWGRHAVLETLRSQYWPVLELHVSRDLSQHDQHEVEAAAEACDVDVEFVPHDELRQKCHSTEHQGMIAKMTEFPYASASQVLDSEHQSALYLVLDSIQDPYNFGAMLRTCDGLAVSGVFIAERNQVGVTSLVARTSAGAVNYVPIARVPDIADLLKQLSERGVSSVAASADADAACYDTDLVSPTAIVIGNEGRGIHPKILSACSRTVAIPQMGHVDSFNAAISASVLLYEARRQRLTTI